jgi:hypothetical protein
MRKKEHPSLVHVDCMGLTTMPHHRNMNAALFLFQKGIYAQG